MATAEEIRERAKKIRRNKLLIPTKKNEAYGFLTEGDARLLEAKEDKPRTLVVDAYPLKDIGDISTVDYEFKNTLWVTLVGSENYDRVGQDADGDVRTMAALFPEHIETIQGTGKEATFQGELLVGNEAWENARTEMMVQAMLLTEKILAEEVTLKDETFFFGRVSLSKSKDRTFVNPQTHEPTTVAEPAEYTGGAVED